MLVQSVVVSPNDLFTPGADWVCSLATGQHYTQNHDANSSPQWAGIEWVALPIIQETKIRVNLLGTRADSHSGALNGLSNGTPNGVQSGMYNGNSRGFAAEDSAVVDGLKMQLTAAQNQIAALTRQAEAAKRQQRSDAAKQSYKAPAQPEQQPNGVSLPVTAGFCLASALVACVLL